MIRAQSKAPYYSGSCNKLPKRTLMLQLPSKPSVAKPLRFTATTAAAGTAPCRSTSTECQRPCSASRDEAVAKVLDYCSQCQAQDGVSCWPGARDWVVSVSYQWTIVATKTEDRSTKTQVLKDGVKGAVFATGSVYLGADGSRVDFDANVFHTCNAYTVTVQAQVTTQDVSSVSLLSVTKSIPFQTPAVHAVISMADGTHGVTRPLVLQGDKSWDEYKQGP